MRYWFSLGVLLIGLFQTSQVMAQEIESLDERYLEDQFYVGLGFNFMLDRPTNVVQRSLSYNLQGGFIKDIPFNRNRNFGIGIGLGYGVNSFYSNIQAEENNGNITYQVVSTDAIVRSKFETHTLEFPFELRWRTSTASEYKFWRVYAGAKFGYVFSGRSRLVLEEGSNGFSNSDLQDWQYGLTLSFGYNTWNIRAYYALNPLLNDGIQLDNGEAIDMRVLRIGVIFYIL